MTAQVASSGNLAKQASFVRLCSDPLLSRIYAARGIQSPDQLLYELKRLHHFDTLKGIYPAVARLEQALHQGDRITVLGDFDADGATGTVIAVKSLKAMGFESVDYFLPNRFEYGYGLTAPLVPILLSTQQPGLVITVDNGISSCEGVAACKSAGIEVVITDHHLPGDVLPEACAVVNPNQEGDTFPSKCLSGAGVVFYLMLALRSRLKASGWFAQQNISPPNLSACLDLVAIGAIADMVELDYNNRILVYHGIQHIREKRCCIGVQALFKVAGRRTAQATSADIGFSIGPRLNAAGRLKDMQLGVQCLLSTVPEQAFEMAQLLDQLNTERKAIESAMKVQAMALIERERVRIGELPVALCLYDSGWHQGVSGIVAGRLKEAFGRPVAVFACADSGLLKASLRSVSGLNIREVLADIAQQQPDVLIRYGGHAQAAGLSLEAKQYPLFKRLFLAVVGQRLKHGIPTPLVKTDGELRAKEYSIAVADALRYGGPWGQGFPEPKFQGKFKLLSQAIVGNKHLSIRVRPCQEGDVLRPDFFVKGIYFNVDLAHWPNPECQWVHLVYRLDVNEYRDVRSVQLIIELMKPADSTL